jgi:hypothetical protein
MKKNIIIILSYIIFIGCVIIELGIVIAVIFGLYHSEFNYETAIREPDWNRRLILIGTFILALTIQFLLIRVIKKTKS